MNLESLRRGQLTVEQLGRGIACLDTGTHMSLLEASHFIGTLEARQDLKIGCLEEIALRVGYIDRAQMEQVIESTPRSSYKECLEGVLTEHLTRHSSPHFPVTVFHRISPYFTAFTALHRTSPVTVFHPSPDPP